MNIMIIYIYISGCHDLFFCKRAAANRILKIFHLDKNYSTIKYIYIYIYISYTQRFSKARKLGGVAEGGEEREIKKARNLHLYHHHTSLSCQSPTTHSVKTFNADDAFLSLFLIQILIFYLRNKTKNANKQKNL